jgi:hypothetical protein
MVADFSPDEPVALEFDENLCWMDLTVLERASISFAARSCTKDAPENTAWRRSSARFSRRSAQHQAVRRAAVEIFEQTRHNFATPHNPR